MADKLSIGAKITDAGLRLYDKFADRSQMPTNRRIFLESVLDKSKEPITESSLTPAELETLNQVIFNKYKPIENEIDKYEQYLSKSLASHNQAVAAKNKDKMLYPEFYQRYLTDFDAIQKFKNGQITPDFLDLAAGNQDYVRSVAFKSSGVKNKFNVKPVVRYEDYGVENDQARRAFSGADPRESLHTILGRFQYTVDPETNALVVTDKYDFNPNLSMITGTYKKNKVKVQDASVATAPESGGVGLYRLLREYAGEVLPEGAGRDVRIELNRLAPPVANSLVKK